MKIFLRVQNWWFEFTEGTWYCECCTKFWL